MGKRGLLVIKNRVESVLGCSLELVDVVKNNGVVLHGLRQKDGVVRPVVYIDILYQRYISGELSLDDVVEEIVSCLNKSASADIGIRMGFLFDFSNARERIVYKLINYEKNKKMLMDAPHIRLLDLAIVFKLLPELEDECEDTEVSMIVTSDIARVWGNISADELFKLAEKNTPRLCGYEISNIRDIVLGLLKAQCPDIDKSFLDTILGPEVVPMYILSNKTALDGAAALLYPDLLKDFSDAAGGNLLIIPSSVDEVILVPQNMGGEAVLMKDSIPLINESEVLPNKVLSDNLYYYNRDLNKITIYNEKQ